LSSTNRGYDRHKSDYYVTPIDKVVEFLNAFQTQEPNALRHGVILDPSAGGDEENPMSYPEALEMVGVKDHRIHTIDIREDSRADVIGNYLALDTSEILPEDPSVIITNPPFVLAEPIVEKALRDVKPGGYVIMLLRLNFFGGKARNERFYPEVGMPKYAFVHHRRMSFTPDGKTDSIEYAHFVWQRGYDEDSTKLYVI